MTLINVKNVTAIEMNGVAGDNTIKINQVERKDKEGNASLDGNGNPITDSLYVVEGVQLEKGDKNGSWFYQSLLTPKIVREIEDENYVPGKKVGYIKWIMNVEPGEFIIEFFEYDEYFYTIRIQDNEVYLLVKSNEINVLTEYYELLVKREMVDPFG